MAKFKTVDVPNIGPVDFPASMSNQEISAAVQKIIQQQAPVAPTRTAGQQFQRGAGLALRGAAPVATGAGLGFMVGGPPGALAGSLALPLAEIGTQAANVILPENLQIPSPVGGVESLLTRMGFPVPQTTTERGIQAAGGALGGTASQLSTLPSIAKTASTELGRNIAGEMARAPGRQLAASAPAAIASQAVGEDYGPVAGMVAGMAAGAPFSAGLKTRQLDQIPTTEELKQTASRLYKFADDSGVAFKKSPFQTFATKTAAELRKEGVDATLTPKADAALRRLESASTSPITLSELERLRRIALISATSNDAADRSFGGKLIQKIDEFVENSNPSQFRVQDQKAMDALKEARQLWKQGKKSQILENIFDVAELRAETNFTQSGMEQALRSRLTNLAANEKLMRQFNKTEQQAIRDAAKGGSMQNFFRYVGKLAPTSVIPAAGGFVIGQQLFGADVGAMTAAVPAAAGIVSRNLATSQGLRRFQQLEDMLRLGRQPRTSISGTAPVLTRGLISSQQPVTEEEINLLSGR